MVANQEGLTTTYNRFHDPREVSANIQTLRDLHVEMDKAVAAAYGWADLGQKLAHGFHDTKQGTRFTIGELARREVLARLLKLNHERYAVEVAQGLHDKKKGKARMTLKKAAVADTTSGLFVEGGTATHPSGGTDSLARDARCVTELFHRLNSVLPQEQKVVSVPPDLPAVDALKRMEEHGFSQLPVTVGKEVLGVFSFRSYANAVVGHAERATKNQKFNPLELLVEDCLQKVVFARVTDEFVEWFEFIDKHDALLVGEPNHLQGVVTAMDILRYLYGVASPFVLIGEIELALRALMQLSVTVETLTTCARECLKEKYPTDCACSAGGHDVQRLCADHRGRPQLGALSSRYGRQPESYEGET